MHELANSGNRIQHVYQQYYYCMEYEYRGKAIISITALQLLSIRLPLYSVKSDNASAVCPPRVDPPISGAKIISINQSIR